MHSAMEICALVFESIQKKMKKALPYFKRIDYNKKECHYARRKGMTPNDKEMKRI